MKDGVYVIQQWMKRIFTLYNSCVERVFTLYSSGVYTYTSAA